MKKKTQRPDQGKANQSHIQLLRHVQGTWASWMERKTSTITPGTWYILLLLFVMVSIAFNSWLIYDSLTDREGREIYLSTVGKRDAPFSDDNGQNDTLSKKHPLEPLHTEQK
ncbi:hypothetical protein SAMN04487891_102377 [Flagellimonas taeanensis]|uniref:Uncharacterized protein n=1 Tax=Flagellimonas taeanensis TaxID=1005926 RepID=A0A1M6SB74_9FLAO|nr:hypothetical protein [Allomuricauda taeanensis]SFB79541.1 hypothetical protein SAMN04487891_102377 [Allomuricauda taeanensis]SHK41767.1 hypothetical protein SAMN05216293_1056 [Allomuricauda taeanensis]